MNTLKIAVVAGFVMFLSIALSASVLAQSLLQLPDDDTTSPYDILREGILQAPSMAISLRLASARPTGAGSPYAVRPSMKILPAPILKEGAEFIQKATEVFEMLKAQNNIIQQCEIEAGAVTKEVEVLSSQIDEIVGKLDGTGVVWPEKPRFLEISGLCRASVTKEELAQVVLDLQTAIGKGDLKAVMAILANKALEIDLNNPSSVPGGIAGLVSNTTRGGMHALEVLRDYKTSYLAEAIKLYDRYVEAKDLAIKALAELLNVKPDTIKVKSVTSEYGKGSDVPYLSTQVIIPGFKITLSYHGKTYEYHTDMNGRIVLDPKQRKEMKKAGLIQKANKALEMLTAQNSLMQQYDNEADAARSEMDILESQITEIIGKLEGTGIIAPDRRSYVSPILMETPVTREMLAQMVLDLKAAIDNGDRKAIKKILANKALKIDLKNPSSVPENLAKLVINAGALLNSINGHLGECAGYLAEISSIYNGYQAAVKSLMAIVNPSSYILDSWQMDADGNMLCNFKLPDGSIFGISVNKVTGEALPVDKALTDAMMKVRNETSQKLNIALGDVHVNGVDGHMFSYAVYKRAPDFTIHVTTAQFEFTYFWNGLSDSLKLQSLINRGTGVDLYANAVKSLMEIVNPSSYTLGSWQMDADGNMTCNFKLQDGSKFGISVNKKTGEAWPVDNALADAVRATRNELGVKMGMVDGADIHVNGVSTWTEIIGHSWDGNIYHDAYCRCFPLPYYKIAHYVVTSSVGNYTITTDSTTIYKGGYYWWNIIDDTRVLIDDPLMPYATPTLLSFVDNNTGVDYVKDAQNKVLELLNYEYKEYKYKGVSISDWHMENGVLKGVLKINTPYSLLSLYWKPQSIITIGVDIDLATGIVQIDKNVVDAVMKARNETSQKLNIALGDVHVSNITWVGDGVGNGYGLDVATPQFDIRYNFYDGGQGLKLISLVNRETGVDLYANAVKSLMAIVNPSSYTLGVWYITENRMTCKFKLQDGGDEAVTFGIGVNAVTGEAFSADSVLADAVTKARNETAQRLSIALGDVHVNNITWVGDYVGIGCGLDVVTPQFNIRYNFYDGSEGLKLKGLKLISLVNRETGVDLYANAVKSLMEIVNPSSYTLDSWQMDADGNMTCNFKLQDGSIFGISVNKGTGEALPVNSALADAVRATRDALGIRMGMVDGADVHVNGVSAWTEFYKPYINLDIMYPAEYSTFCPPYPYPYPYPYSKITHYVVTSSVGNYTLTTDYTTIYKGGYYWWNIIDDTRVRIDDPLRLMPRFTLLSFVDNNTGVDYVKDAQNKVHELFNYKVGVLISNWHMENGVLRLDISPLDISPYISLFSWWRGERLWSINIGVDIDLATGIVQIDKNVVDAVMKARNETSQKLNIALGDVHVNNITWVGDGVGNGYGLDVVTPQFNIRYNFYDGGQGLKLISLVNRETGVDLYANAVKSLMEIVNPSSYTLDSWQMDADGNMTCNFKLQNGSIFGISVNKVTGEALPVDKALAKAVRATRDALGIRMGMVDGADVHVNGVSTWTEFYKPYIDFNGWDSRIWPRGKPHYVVTSSVGNYTITTDTTPRFPEFYQNRRGGLLELETRLTSLVDNNTGVDLYANASNYLRDVLGQSGSNLQDWSIGEDGVFTFALSDGTSVDIHVELATGRAWDKNTEMEKKVLTGEREAREYLAGQLAANKEDITIIGSENVTPIREEGLSIQKEDRLITLEHSGIKYYVRTSTNPMIPNNGWGSFTQVNPSDPLIAEIKSREYLAGQIGADKEDITIIGSEDVKPDNLEGSDWRLVTLNYNGVTYYVKTIKVVYPGAEWGGFEQVADPDRLREAAKPREGFTLEELPVPPSTNALTEVLDKNATIDSANAQANVGPNVKMVSDMAGKKTDQSLLPNNQ